MQHQLQQQEYLQIQIADGKICLLDKRIIQVSNLIQQQIHDNPNEVIKLELINDNQLQFVQNYLNLHNYDLSNSKVKQYAQSSNLQDNVYNALDIQLFEKMPVDDITHILKAAAYLQIECLVQLCEVALATKIYIGYDEPSIQLIKDTQNLGELNDDDIISMKEKYPFAFSNYECCNHTNESNTATNQIEQQQDNQ